MKVFFKDSGKYINIKHIDNYKRRSQAVKMHCKHNKICYDELAEKYGVLHKCGFCGELNRHYYFETEVSDGAINIVDVKYHGDALKYCHTNPLCPGKKLNANSVEFVSVTRNLTMESALVHIKKRNSSPFYKENHVDTTAYSKYQGGRVFDKSPDVVQLILDKQKYSNSLDGKKEKYGVEEGEIIWNSIQSSKGITAENLCKKYGTSKGLEKYDEYKHSRSGGSFGNLSRTKRNELLRSDLENAFYKCMIKYDLHLENYEVERYYPNSNQKSDFFFGDLDMHIEIAGMMHHVGYRDKMKQKQSDFGCMILDDIGEFDNVCQTIRLNINEKQSNAK